jgi:hypothetical protein
MADPIVSRVGRRYRAAGGLEGPAPTNDHDFLDAAWAQRIQRAIGDIGERKHVGVGQQHARDVDRDLPTTTAWTPDRSAACPELRENQATSSTSQHACSFCHQRVLASLASCITR